MDEWIFRQAQEQGGWVSGHEYEEIDVDESGNGRGNGGSEEDGSGRGAGVIGQRCWEEWQNLPG